MIEKDVEIVLTLRNIMKKAFLYVIGVDVFIVFGDIEKSVFEQFELPVRLLDRLDRRTKRYKQLYRMRPVFSFEFLPEIKRRYSVAKSGRSWQPEPTFRKI